ncbi:Glycogen accumulation regulator GarA [bacterium HR15]|nr:Glycogen accumulation regulator GarA [bacterium HR15]
MQEESTILTGSNAPQATIQMTPAPSATQAIAPTQCPICGQMNPPGEMYCIECGFLLTSEIPAEAPTAEGVFPKLRDASGREFLLKAGENLIGRDPSSDVLLNDGTVSRRHARIVIEGNTAYLEDLGSTNGTRLNGQSVSPGQRVPLPQQAELQLGSVTLTLELPEGFETPVVAEEVAPPLAYLVNPQDPSQRYPLYARPLKIGRRTDNDIVIPDPYVSGSHATIEIVGNEVRITDLGSTNGTFIGEVRLTPNLPAPVEPGAILTLGKSQFVVEWASAPTEEPTPSDTSHSSDSPDVQGNPDVEVQSGE